MALPIRYSRGSLGQTGALAPAATHEFEDCVPGARARLITFYLRTTGAGTLVLQRVDPARGAFPLLSQTITATAEETAVTLNLAPGDALLRAFFSNTGGVNVAVSLDVAWS